MAATERTEERTAPVAIPGPGAWTLEDRRDEPAAADGDDDEPFDWRVTAAVFAFLWAAFTSLVMSVAPPTWGGFLAWFVATAALGTEVLRQRYLWVRHERRQLALVTSPVAPFAPLAVDSALRGEAGEEGLAANDMDGIEPGLDEDPA